jgi:hypothetical protein
MNTLSNPKEVLSLFPFILITSMDGNQNLDGC